MFGNHWRFWHDGQKMNELRTNTTTVLHGHNMGYISIQRILHRKKFRQEDEIILKMTQLWLSKFQVVTIVSTPKIRSHIKQGDFSSFTWNIRTFVTYINLT